MIGLIIKDFLVFKKRFHLTYRLIGAAVLGLVIILYPAEGAQYVALLLPVMGVAFLTEIVKVEEKSDWRDYLPALPIISREIVLSRYLFCGILFSARGCQLDSGHRGRPAWWWRRGTGSILCSGC